MAIELDWVKKLYGETIEKFNNFFLAHFNTKVASSKFCNNKIRKALGKIKTGFGIREVEKSNVPACNFPGAFEKLITNSSSGPGWNVVKKMVLTRQKRPVLGTITSHKSLFQVVITFSLSCLDKYIPKTGKLFLFTY